MNFSGFGKQPAKEIEDDECRVKAIKEIV